MSSRRFHSHRSSKAVDQSTDWTDWDWDPGRQCWYRERKNENGETVYDFAASSSAQDIPRSEAGSTASTAYNSSTPNTDQSYYATEEYTSDPVDTLTRTFSSTTITPSSHAKSYRHDPSSPSYAGETSDRSDIHVADPLQIPQISTIPHTYGFSSSAPAGGYMGSHQSRMNSMASGYIPENSTGYYSGNQIQNSAGYNVSYATPISRPNTLFPMASSQVPSPESYSSKAPSPYETGESSGTGNITPKIPHKNITGTPGNKERLDPNFKIHGRSDFKPCKVFKVLWSEPEGTTRADNTEVTESFVGKTKHGESVYTTIRRFVIVASDHAHCQCVPILTYNHRGTSKNGAQSKEHAIIYTGPDVPREVKGEERLRNTPIQVITSNPRNKLAPESRVNYAKIYTVEYNVKVLFIGEIAKSHESKFMKDFDAAWQRKWKVSGY